MPSLKTESEKFWFLEGTIYNDFGEAVAALRPLIDNEPALLEVVVGNNWKISEVPWKDIARELIRTDKPE